MISSIISRVTPLFGICPFEKVKDNLINCRAKGKLPDNPKSIIVMLFPYRFCDEMYIGSDISKYACVKDYHTVIENALQPVITELKEKFPNFSFVSFSDNSPVPEVTAAVYAGLGVRGKNGLLINKEYGSYVFIGEIVTDMEIQTVNTVNSSCIGCNKCINNCPNKAISQECISKLNCLSDITQRKGKLSDEQIDMIKSNNCLWGCDICQDVCPMNKNIKINPFKDFCDGFENKMRCDGDISDRAYAWRGIETVRRNCNIERKS